jgi:hypothetical protein
MESISFGSPASSRISASLDFEKKFVDNCDDTFLGSIIGWLLEASEDYKIELSKKDLAKLTRFVYREATEDKLNFNEARHLALTTIKVKDLLESR